MLTNEQNKFLEDEMWLLSFNGAFQRNRIYTENASENQKKAFRTALKRYISNNILSIYKSNINEEHHTAFIVSIVSVSKNYKSILRNGQISIGTAQKLLNLILKYYWCLGWTKEPLHFPIDSIIQKHIPANSRRKWTEIYSLEEYMSVIDAAKNQLEEGETLAQWELKNYRRN